MTLSSGITLSKRVVYMPGEGLDVLVQVLAPAAKERRLREVLGALPLLPRSPAPGWTLPQDDDGLQRLLDGAPSLRALLVNARYAAGPLWFACPFRASYAWPRVAAQAAGPIGYQTTLYAYACPGTVQREISLNLDRLSLHPAVPGSMRWLQRQVADRARHARWIQEEVLLAATSADAELWTRQVEVVFGGLHAEFGEPPELTFGVNGWQDNLELACSFDEELARDPSYVASQVQDLANGRAQLGLAEDFDGISATLAAQLTPRSINAAADPRCEPGTDPPRRYAFLSYAHIDATDMQRVRDCLYGAGFHVWVDERLEGGQEWDAELEAGIRDCDMLVALISPESVASRWVRREIKFADSLSKPLICLRLRETALTDGLGLLLLSLQWIDGTKADADERLLRAATLMMQGGRVAAGR